MKMVKISIGVMLLLAVANLAFVVKSDDSETTIVKKVKGQKVCKRGWECPEWSKFCCNQTISDFFQTYQFENLFPKRNAPVAHAIGFWDYQSFITASVQFQPLGFCTTGGKQMQMKELAAFLGHVGYKTSCQCSYFPSLWLMTHFPSMHLLLNLIVRTMNSMSCADLVESRFD